MINTILVVIEQMLLHLPLICGAYISYSLLKVPDLSIESAYVFGAIIGSYTSLYTVQLPVYIALFLIILASAMAGSMVGLISSVLTQKGHFSHLLSCIITFGLFHGFNQCIAPTYFSLSAIRNPLSQLDFVAQYPEMIILGLIGLIIVSVLSMIFKTQIGHSFAVYGGNPFFFSNYGISAPFVFITGIMLANAFAGISGYLFAQSNNFVELNMGLGKVLLCLTSFILGKGLAHIKKPFSVLVPIFGSFAYFTLQQLLLKVGFNLKYFTAVQAFLVMCVLLYTYRTKSNHRLQDSLGV